MHLLRLSTLREHLRHEFADFVNLKQPEDAEEAVVGCWGAWLAHAYEGWAGPRRPGWQWRCIELYVVCPSTDPRTCCWLLA